MIQWFMSSNIFNGNSHDDSIIINVAYIVASSVNKNEKAIKNKKLNFSGKKIQIQNLPYFNSKNYDITCKKSHL